MSWLALTLVLAAGLGQAPASAPEPLVVRQSMAQDRMAQFEDQVFRLSERLAASRPAEAERLRDALRRSGELLVRQEMQRAAEFLQQGQPAAAADHQEKAAAGLDTLLALMLEREQVASRPAPTTQVSLEELAELQRLIARMLARQMDLKSRTGQASTRPAEFGKLAEQQRELARQAASRPSDQRQRLKRAAEAMKRAAEQLAASQPAEAQTEQGKAIEALSKEQRALAAQLQQLQQAKQGRPSTQPAQGQAKPQQMQTSAQAKPQSCDRPSAEIRPDHAAGGAAPVAPADESRLGPGAPGGESLHAGSRAMPGEAWGRMPPQQRERVMQSIREGFAPGYQELVEQYYRQLATRPE